RARPARGPCLASVASASRWARGENSELSLPFWPGGSFSGETQTHKSGPPPATNVTGFSMIGAFSGGAVSAVAHPPQTLQPPASHQRLTAIGQPPTANRQPPTANEPRAASPLRAGGPDRRRRRGGGCDWRSSS